MASTPSEVGRGRRHRVPLAALLVALALALPTHGARPPAEEPADPPGLAAALAGEASPEPIPSYHLSVEPGPMRRLMAFRQKIFARAALPPDERLWVPATFIHERQRHAAKIRIRGDLPVHWRGRRQSLRVKFRDRLFEGRKEINLILPGDKHYGVEVLQTRVAADLGLPYFPSRFVNLEVNGSDAGLYLENEHPTREWLERTGRPASSIFTFSAWWSLYFSQPTYHFAYRREGSRALLPLEGAAQIKQRQTWDPERPELAKKQLAYALELHRLLSEGSRSEIAERAPLYLDLENFARYAALQDFFGSEHAMALNDNLRLYLDPTSGRFLFMPWDTSLRPLDERQRRPGASPATLLAPENAGFAALLEVPGVRARRDELLAELVAEGPRYRAELNRIHARLVRLYPEDDHLRRSARGFDRLFGRNLATLRSYLKRNGAG